MKLAALFSGVKNRSTIIEGLGSSQYLINNNNLYKYIFNYLYRMSLFKSRNIFFTNKEDEKYFLINSISTLENTFYIGGIGVDLSFWICSRDQKNTKVITFIMSTRLLRSKGVLVYLKAAEIIKKDHAEVKFILLGGVDDNPDSLSLDDLQYLIQNNIVEYLGDVNNVKEITCGADVFVLPSYYGEGVPRSIQEAMSCSMPVITTDWTGCRDTVDNYVNGILSPVKDIQSLCLAMDYYIINRKKIKEHGDKSRAFAEENYDAYKKARDIEKRITLFYKDK